MEVEEEEWLLCTIPHSFGRPHSLIISMKALSEGVWIGGLDLRLSMTNMGTWIQMRQGKQQQEERGTISMKFCEKGSGWAWVTATWQARIKTSDLSSMPGGLWPGSHL